MSEPSRVDDESLEHIEELLLRAFSERTSEHVNVMGFGEIGVAVGWPTQDPQTIVKRLASSPDPADAAELFGRIDDYERRLAPHVRVTQTEHRTVTNRYGWTVPYLVQPLYPRFSLVEEILATSEPRVGHPALVAIRDAVVSAASDGLQAIDSQVSNFAWVDGEVVLFDTSSPAVWDMRGKPDTRLGSYGRALPGALHPVIRKVMTKILTEMRPVRGGLVHCALSVLRIEQQRWLPAVLATMNEILDEPIVGEEVEARLADVQKDMRTIKTLARTQRLWTTRVRRDPYDFFITDSFTKEML